MLLAGKVRHFGITNVTDGWANVMMVMLRMLQSSTLCRMVMKLLPEVYSGKWNFLVLVCGKYLTLCTFV